MKTKIIPFDIELAKKIQAGEIEGKIKTKCGNEVRMLCFDLIDPRDVSFPIVCALYSDKYVRVVRFTEYGRYSGAAGSELDLVLEIPDNKTQFKPFDKVLVRDCSKGGWQISFFSHIQDDWFITNNGHMYKECIPFAGNEHLVGTTDNPE